MNKYQNILLLEVQGAIPLSCLKQKMSSIHYKFRSLKDYDTYTFEGAGVPVWELKQEIISVKKLNRANDFDLIISNAQTNQGNEGKSEEIKVDS